MAADVRRPHERRLDALPRRLTRGFYPKLPPVEPLIVDPVDNGRSDLVLVPGHAPHRLVEMGVCLDQSRQHQLSFALLDHCTGWRANSRRDARYATTLDK